MKITPEAIELAEELREVDATYEEAEAEYFNAQDEQAEVHERTPKAYFLTLEELEIDKNLRKRLHGQWLNRVADLLVLLGNPSAYEVSTKDLEAVRKIVEALEDE